MEAMPIEFHHRRSSASYPRGALTCALALAFFVAPPASPRALGTGPAENGTAKLAFSATTASKVSSRAFQGSIEKITPTEKRWMTGESWHKGCPVSIGNLRLLRLDYNNFDGDSVEGRMVVNRKVAKDVLGVFESLFNEGFALEYVDATDLYPPAQRPDKLRNVSASFNCRFIAGTRTWSQHAYGLAVDINPVQNPWVKDDKVVPRVGRPYADRSQDLQGMIHRHDTVTHAFSKIGWGWGGSWRSPKDYMHFSLTGE